MSDFRESRAFARLVAVFVERAHDHDWSIDEAGAALLLADRITRVATLTRRSPSTVVHDYRPRDVISFVDARVGATTPVVSAAAEPDRPLAVPVRALASVTASLAQVAQVAAHNGDLDTLNAAVDALRGLTGAMQAANAPVNVTTHAVQRARVALGHGRRGIGTGWQLHLDEPPGRIAAVLSDLASSFERSVFAIDRILETAIDA